MSLTIVSLLAVSLSGTSLAGRYLEGPGPESMPIFHSSTFKYIKCSLLGFGLTALVFEAARVGIDSPITECLPHSTRVALKCVGRLFDAVGEPRYDFLASEVDIVRSLNGNAWNLDVLDYFVDDGFECAAFEQGGTPVEEHLTDTTFCQRTAMGFRMVDVIHDLHTAGVAHRDLHLGNWLGNPQDLRSLTLIDFGSAVRDVSEDELVRDFSSLRRAVCLLLFPTGAEADPILCPKGRPESSLDTIHLIVSSLNRLWHDNCSPHAYT